MSSVSTEPDPGLYGGASVDHQQGYKPMDLVPNENTPPPAEEPDLPIADERDTPLSAEEAAKFLSESRQNRAAQEEAPPPEPPRAPKPIPREYVRQSGRDAGKTMPANETVTAERAGEDLQNLRAEEQAAEQAALDAELASAIDRARSGEAQQPDQQQQPHQSEQPAQPAADDVWQNPRVIEAVSQYTNEVNAALQQSQQQYEAAVQQNAVAALSVLVAQFPELQGLQTQQELQTAIQTVSRTNPDRGRAITDYIGRINGLVTEAQRVQDARQAAAVQQLQQQQVAAQQWFQKSAEADDNQFEKYARGQGLSDQNLAEIRQEARAMLRDDYGIDEKTMAALWNSDPVFRSYQSQRLILDATRWRIAQRGVRNKQFNQIPAVSRPGSPAERQSQAEYDVSRLSAKLSQDASPRSAAELLIARRRARGR